jgi:hypothetical protein
VATFSSAQQSAAANTKPTSFPIDIPSWPRVFDRNGMHLVVYQPQLRALQRYQAMVADTAISVTDNGGKPLLGVISWRADTFTNVIAGAVYVNDIQVLDARFPSLNSAQESKMKEDAHQRFPTITFTIGLPSMIASLEKVNEPVRSIGQNTEEPSILVASGEAQHEVRADHADPGPCVSPSQFWAFR